MEKIKNNRRHMIHMRLNDSEYLFLQGLREDNISMTNFIMDAIKDTQRYRNYYNLVKGV